MGKVVLISSFAIIVNADMISSFLEGKTVVFDFYKEVADAKRAEEAEYYPSLSVDTYRKQAKSYHNCSLCQSPLIFSK